MVRGRFVCVFAVIILLLSSCSASTEILAIDGSVPAGANDEPTGTGQPDEPVLSSEAVYQVIENSVVFVQPPDQLSSGSGIVIEGGWILTNAHVVDRQESMLIGNSDGEALGLFPVHAVDWVFDLALIGPLTDSSLVPIQRGESSAMSLGARVLLAGFPDEDSAAPTPTLTEGIVSRRRFVSLGDYPFLQVDATIAPGQSGGALVNGRGELVGISGLEFGAGEFGLAFASDPMWPRIDDMIERGGPGLPIGPPSFELNAQVGPLRNYGFTVEVEEDGGVDIQVTSDADIWLDVQTLGGITVSLVEESVDPFRLSGVSGELYLDELVEGGENAIATVEPGTYQVVIGSFTETIEDVEITSANPLRAFVDVEESQTLPVGLLIEGEFDWVRDTDRWELPLVAGQQVSIMADGLADTIVVVQRNGELVTSSDDEGLGLLALAPESISQPKKVGPTASKSEPTTRPVGVI